MTMTRGYDDNLSVHFLTKKKKRKKSACKKYIDGLILSMQKIP